MWIVDEPGGYYGPSECLFTPTIKLNRAWTMPNPDATSANLLVEGGPTRDDAPNGSRSRGQA